MSDNPQAVVSPVKKFDTKSPIFIGICIVIAVVIMVVLYVVYTSSTKQPDKSDQSNKLTDKAPLPKLKIKLATNDFEINNLINKINKSG